MLRLALPAFLFVAPLCSQQPLPLRGELPAIGTVGDVPAADTLTIELHDDGTLTIGALPVRYDELVDRVRERAAATPGEQLGGWQLRALHVHVRAAAALPLAAVQQVVMACVSDDNTAVPRVFFGARHVDDGREGAFAWFLPLDDLRDPVETPDAPKPLIVRLRRGSDGDPAGLAAVLTREARAMDAATRRRATVLVEASGDLRWATALSVLDATARAGLGRAVMQRAMTPAQRQVWNAAGTRHDLRALVAASPVVDDVGCRVGPATVFANGASPAPPRTTGAFAGFAEVTLCEPPPPPPESPNAAVRGGNPAAAAAIARGLVWLSRHQDQDGKWDCDGFAKHDRGADAADGAGEGDHDLGVTGLALLAFLADGNTPATGPYAANVAKAADWLVKQQQANGLIGANKSHDYIYGHAIATLALVEACGQGAQALRPSAQRALDYLETHRNPYSVWRYQPRDNDNDTAVTSWCVHAYSAARDHDFKVNETALRLAETWLDQVASPNGHHGYTRQGEESARLVGDHATRFPRDKNEAMTGTGLFLRYLLGQSIDGKPICGRAADLVVAKLPQWTPDDGNIDLYAWYWCSLAMFQAGGTWWQAWQPAVTNALVAGQARRGAADGSWDPIGVWGEVGGRVYATAMATMTLQTPYRIARITR